MTDPTIRGAEPLARGSGDNAGVEIVRSEEYLQAGVQTVAVRRVRVRKVVLTEERTITVRLRREELRLEEEPIPGGDPAVPHDGAREVVMVLHEERPVVSTEVVAVERVRVGVHTVTEHQTVTEQVRREVVDAVQPPVTRP